MAKEIIRGAVFWYDHAGVRDKTQHLVKMGERPLRSSVIAGKRPWVVVSEPKEGVREKLCTIVPMSSSKTIEARGRVQFQRKGEVYTVLVEQIQTVDSSVLRNYFYQLKEDTMRLLDEALIKHLSLEGNPDSKDLEIAELKAKLEKFAGNVEEVKEFKSQKANLSRLLRDREKRIKELEAEVMAFRQMDKVSM